MAGIPTGTPTGGSTVHTAALAFTDPTIPSAGSNLVTASADPVTSLAHGVADAAGAALAALAHVWANPPSPGLGELVHDGTVAPSAAVGLLQGSLAWYTAALAVVAVLLAAGRMAWQRRGQPLIDLLRGLGTLVLVSAAGLTTVTLLVGAADAFSAWILSRVTPDVSGSLVSLVALPQGSDVPVVLSIFLDVVVMVAAVLQIGLLLARGGVLVLLTGLLPLTASASGTETGRSVFTRMLTWLVAFILYQPLAASIYAVAFLVAPDQQDSPVVATITGASALVLALIALPALMRVLRPATVAVLTRRGGSPVGGTAPPTGARSVPPLGSGPTGLPVVLGAPATVLRTGSAAPVRAAGALAVAGPAGRTRRPAITGGRRPRTADGLPTPPATVVDGPGELPPAAAEERSR